MSTPYELRFKVLEMARDQLMLEYNTMEGTYWPLHAKIEQAIEDGSPYASELIDELVKLKPKVPSPERVKEMAAELYEFVERRPRKARKD